ncbi:MAG: SGNH/GDSL hydrolase family protein [Pseudomonadota bacterium]|nr:SGNH/GDSL hydrolase family protein [Pseudomonadota bacterium]
MARGRIRPDIVTWIDLDFDDGFPSFPDQQFLAEGDSWFTISGFPVFNLLFELRFHKHTRIVNCGFPGDTIKNMSAIARNPNLRQALTSRNFTWDAILLSGGGNDLIDEADDIILAKNERGTVQTPADYCDQQKLGDLMAEIQDGYQRIAALRDRPGNLSRHVPIVTHTYDYSTPRNSPARFFLATLGPWLFKALKNQQVPGADWVAVADYLADQLAEAILALEKGSAKIKNFHVVDTRGTLKRAEQGATSSSNDWQNEIHPNANGYEKLAKRIEKQLHKVLP